MGKPASLDRSVVRQANKKGIRKRSPDKAVPAHRVSMSMQTHHRQQHIQMQIPTMAAVTITKVKQREQTMNNDGSQWEW